MRFPILSRLATLATLIAAAPIVLTDVRAQAPSAPRAAPEAAFTEAKAKALDALFAALQRAGTDAEADPIVAEIWTLWTRSGQQDIDLLMAKAAGAMQARDYGLAVLLLDAVVADAPLFAEGWNRRATVRFLMNDHQGSLADIEKVLALEPRHFGALAGRGMIHMAAERWEEALAAWREALAVNPFLKERHRVIPELQRRVERGRL